MELKEILQNTTQQRTREILGKYVMKGYTLSTDPTTKEILSQDTRCTKYLYISADSVIYLSAEPLFEKYSNKNANIFFGIGIIVLIILLGLMFKG